MGAEEWLKGQFKLSWPMLAVSKAQKKPDFLHPGYLILPMDFSRKHVGVLVYL
jgi:hypothetical protein